MANQLIVRFQSGASAPIRVIPLNIDIRFSDGSITGNQKITITNPVEELVFPGAIYGMEFGNQDPILTPLIGPVGTLNVTVPISSNPAQIVGEFEIVTSRVGITIPEPPDPFPCELFYQLVYLTGTGRAQEEKSQRYQVYAVQFFRNITSTGGVFKYTFNVRDVICDGSCFIENTLILTDKGYVNVQDLKTDDIVITHDNRHVPIKAVICLPALSSPSSDPFLYKAHCFSENYPPIDTYLSPHHAILINDKWDVKGRSDKDLWTHGAHLKYNNFLNENIKQVKIADSFNYYHLYLPDFKTDHLVINHGLVVESYGIDYHITHTHLPEDPRVFTVDLKKRDNEDQKYLCNY